MSGRSALYLGRVMHRRVRPFTHRFDYRVFSLLVDLDELPALGRRLALLSHNRFNLLSFHDRDHGARDGSALRPWAEARLAEAGIDLAGGRIELLSFPRVLGYVFNPLSLWFCRQPDGRLAAVIHEVSNTFGEWHSYVLPVPPGRRPRDPVVQACDKRFHVSPFLGMEGRYRFRIAEPGERLSILVSETEAAGLTLVATMTGRRSPLTDATLARAFLTHPLMTLKVIGAIHWQALRLWLKGGSIHARPPPPRQAPT